MGGPRETGVTTAEILRAVEASPDLVVAIDQDGRLRYVNEGGARSLGYAANELVGQLWAVVVHPDDVAASRWLMEEGRTTWPATEGRWRAVDGSYRRIIWTGTILGRIVYGFGKIVPDGGDDAVPSTGLLARLSETERLANVGSWERRTATGENHWSEGLRRILGVEGGHSFDFETAVLPLVHPEDRASLKRARDEAVQTGHHLQTEFRIVRRDGEVRLLHVRAVFEMDDDGALARSLGVIQDITEQRRTEANLAHARRMEAIGRLTGSVAHDFNNIIGGIKGFAELALQGSEDPQVALREIASVVDDAAELTSSLLRFRVDAENDMSEASELCDVVRRHGPLLDRLVGEDVQLTVHTRGEGHVPLSGSQISQILVNLVVNADDALPDGGDIAIVAAIDDAAALLTVEDTGVGMPAEVADRAFEPFFTTKPVAQGVGLGLSTVYATVTQNGGTVRLESEAGRGTRVHVELPVASPSAAPPDDERTTDVPEGTGQTVLVVDDTPAVLRVVTLALENAGYDVLAAADPQQALAVSSAHEGEIALVLTDVVMPTMSGLALAEQLRRQQPSIAVLYMSGYPQPGQWGVGVEDLDAGLVRKPFGVAEIVGHVSEALRR